jgi:hypothetical protein
MAKQVYKDKNGTKLPGVTTITAELGWNKGVLINWANKLGLKGIESTKFVDDKAAIGTLAHDMVLNHLKHGIVNTADYSANQISQAENCLLSYHNWEKGKVIEPIMLEEPLVSEVYKFGGTMDFFGKIDGVITLNDFKTGKGIYDEYFIQVAGGYLILLEENGQKVEAIQILNIPRSEDEAFQVKPLPKEKWDICKKIFLNCLDNYQLKRKLTKEE